MGSWGLEGSGWFNSGSAGVQNLTGQRAGKMNQCGDDSIGISGD